MSTPNAPTLAVLPVANKEAGTYRSANPATERLADAKATPMAWRRGRLGGDRRRDRLEKTPAICRRISLRRCARP